MALGQSCAAVQQMATIGWLTAQQAASLTPYIDALRSGFAELGYVEGRNLAILFRYGDDLPERVPELASELARVPVDVLMVQGAAVPIVSKLDLCQSGCYLYLWSSTFRVLPPVSILR